MADRNDQARQDLAEYLNGEWPQCFNDGFQDAVAGAILETSLDVRAPEVTQLLAAIWDVAEGESWPGADTVSVLCEWFTANGYDIDAPLAGEDADA